MKKIAINGQDVEVGPDIDLDVEVVRDRAGRRITEADAERLAEEALTQVRGRPSLSGQAAHSPQVSFRVAPDVRTKAEQVAHREGKTVSQLAREALERYLDVA